MDLMPGDISLSLLVFSFAVAMLAGFVKGVIGFAFPTIMIAVLGAIMPPEQALAWLLLPTVTTNLWQSVRQGVKAMWKTMRKYGVFLVAGCVVIIPSAQIVPVMPPGVMQLLISVPVLIYAITTLAGNPVRLPQNPGRGIEAGVGAVAGFFGGISGTWGPPTAAFLTALNTKKAEQVRIQGIIYFPAAVVLALSHLYSGVLNADTIPASALMIVPAMLGIVMGLKMNDRIRQSTFQRITLIALILAGTNLAARGFWSIV
ncbi:MAG: sulfite exporter TauE/SafE family protein [Roseovarius sp.]|nr:sulfite exporter TauE/SafE family protein [Roseovarius sp.]